MLFYEQTINDFSNHEVCKVTDLPVLTITSSDSILISIHGNTHFPHINILFSDIFFLIFLVFLYEDILPTEGTAIQDVLSIQSQLTCVSYMGQIFSSFPHCSGRKDV